MRKAFYSMILPVMSNWWNETCQIMISISYRKSTEFFLKKMSLTRVSSETLESRKALECSADFRYVTHHWKKL